MDVVIPTSVALRQAETSPKKRTGRLLQHSRDIRGTRKIPTKISIEAIGIAV